MGSGMQSRLVATLLTIITVACGGKKDENTETSGVYLHKNGNLELIYAVEDKTSSTEALCFYESIMPMEGHTINASTITANAKPLHSKFIQKSVFRANEMNQTGLKPSQLEKSSFKKFYAELFTSRSEGYFSGAILAYPSSSNLKGTAKNKSITEIKDQFQNDGYTRNVNTPDHKIYAQLKTVILDAAKLGQKYSTNPCPSAINTVKSKPSASVKISSTYRPVDTGSTSVLMCSKVMLIDCLKNLGGQACVAKHCNGGSYKCYNKPRLDSCALAQGGASCVSASQGDCEG